MREAFKALGAVAIACSSTCYAALPDATEHIVDTRIELVDRLPADLYWVDTENLVATTFADEDKSRWWIRKVIVFNTKEKTIKRELSPAFILCANPTKNVINIAKGTLERHFTSNATAPEAVPTWYRWNSAIAAFEEITPERSGSWNKFLCLQTAPEDVEKPSIALYKERSARYLQSEHGILRWKYSPTDFTVPVSLMTPNQAEKPLGVRKGDLALEIQYLPFSNSYLLAPGWFSLGTLRRSFPGTNEAVDEQPMISLDMNSGLVNRTYAIPLLKSHLPRSAHGITFPTARGTLIYVQLDRDEGGGLYLAKKNEIQRIWCIEKPSPLAGRKFPNRCKIDKELISISPDGCKAAFFTNVSINGFDSHLTTAKVLDICATP